MKQIWAIEYDDGYRKFDLVYFANQEDAQEALDHIRQKFMNYYLCTDERIDAWTHRPYFDFVPEYDEDGDRVYVRGQWIEESILDLEDQLSYYGLKVIDVLESVENFEFDPYHRYIDDDRSEINYKKNIEKKKTARRNRKIYFDSRVDKPRGLP